MTFKATREMINDAFDIFADLDARFDLDDNAMEQAFTVAVKKRWAERRRLEAAGLSALPKRMNGT